MIDQYISILQFLLPYFVIFIIIVFITAGLFWYFSIKNIRKREKSRITLGKEKIPLLKKDEPRSFFFIGSAGSGKTQAILSILYQIQDFNEKSIFFEIKEFDFANHFLKNDDVVFNPMLECDNSVFIDVLSEASSPGDIELEVLMLFDDSGGEQIWSNASRDIYRALRLTQLIRGNTSIIAFSDLLNEVVATEDERKLLNNFMDITREAQFKYRLILRFYTANPKLASNIFANTFAVLNQLFQISLYKKPTFSLKEYIKNENDTRKLFIQKPKIGYESVKNYYELLAYYFFTQLNSLPENKDRTIWIILDEVQRWGVLQDPQGRVPGVLDLLTIQRSLGIRTIIATQSLAFLKEIYNNKDTIIEAFFQLLHSKFIFQSTENFTNKYLQDYFGKQTIEERKENTNIGSGDGAQSGYLAWQEKEQYVIEQSEFRSIPPLHCYFAVDNLVTELSFEYIEAVNKIEWKEAKTPTYRIIEQSERVQKTLESVLRQVREIQPYITSDASKKEESTDEFLVDF